MFSAIPDGAILEGIRKLHINIFGTADDLVNKMAGKSGLVIIVALENNKMIGYKVGYEIDKYTFYSWLGGIDPHYRGQGIATALMEKQHQYLKEAGYKVVQTKTRNKWRDMLILNIKNGFDVIDTYTDENGLHKIILEKWLSH